MYIVFVTFMVMALVWPQQVEVMATSQPRRRCSLRVLMPRRTTISEDDSKDVEKPSWLHGSCVAYGACNALKLAFIYPLRTGSQYRDAVDVVDGIGTTVTVAWAASFAMTGTLRMLLECKPTPEDGRRDLLRLSR